MLLAAKAAGGMGGNMWMIILYVVVIVGAMYFLLIRPQKKNEKKQKDLLGNLEVGDSVLTSSGFYGMVIDVQDEAYVSPVSLIRINFRADSSRTSKLSL